MSIVWSPGEHSPNSNDCPGLRIAFPRNRGAETTTPEPRPARQPDQAEKPQEPERQQRLPGTGGWKRFSFELRRKNLSGTPDFRLSWPVRAIAPHASE